MSEIIHNDIQEILSNNLPWHHLEDATVLITGATGMVGSYVVNVLLGLREHKRINVKILALVRNRSKAMNVFAKYQNDIGLEILEQDVTDLVQYENKVDIIIHAASPASPDKFGKDPVGVICANILGSFNMLEFARKNKSKFCFISTMEAYGQLDARSDKEEIYVTEEDYGRINSLELRSAYPESKRAAENLSVAYGAQYGIDYTIARMTHTYGPGMDINDTRVQAEFMRKGLEGHNIVLKTDGSLRRTYTYISDAISGLFYVLLKNDGKRVYNIANENVKLTIKELAQTIINACNGGSKLVMDIQDTTNNMWSKTKNVYADCSRLRNLGWEALVSVDEGVLRTIRYHKENQANH